MKRCYRLALCGVAIAAGLTVILTYDTSESAYKAPAVSTPLRSDVTTLVQTRLKSFGYTIVVDGLYGPQTTRVVKAWQKANGIPQTGFAGKLTLASLGPISFATADPSPAVRSSPPALSPVGSESNCDEMSRYRQAAGLPEQFDAIGYRESRCQNTAGNSCCFGWWANYLSSHLSSQSAYRDRIINECGVTSSARAEIQGDSDAQKRAQACVTFVVWDVTRNLPNHTGMEPWAL